MDVSPDGTGGWWHPWVRVWCEGVGAGGRSLRTVLQPSTFWLCRRFFPEGFSCRRFCPGTELVLLLSSRENEARGREGTRPGGLSPRRGEVAPSRWVLGSCGY